MVNFYKMIKALNYFQLIYLLVISIQNKIPIILFNLKIFYL